MDHISLNGNDFSHEPRNPLDMLLFVKYCETWGVADNLREEVGAKGLTDAGIIPIRSVAKLEAPW